MSRLARLKKILWPIYKKELSIFIPMALMMATVLFNMGLLKSLKDSLIVGGIGAEALSFLKLYIVLPSAILFTICYVALSNRYTLQQVFYIIISIFIGIFLLFGFILYPNYESFHLSTELSDNLVKQYPSLKWLIRLLAKWSYVMIYIVAELWSVVVINLMFWQFANNYLNTEQAKRFYPFLSMVGNFGLFIAGNTLIFCTKIETLPEILKGCFSADHCSSDIITIKLIITVIILASLLSMFLMKYISQIIAITHITAKTRIKKTKLSLLQSVKLIVHSRYIGYITLVVVCYSLAITSVESSWKAKVNSLYPSISEYMYFMGHFNVWIGISCVLFTILSSLLLRKYNWKYAAISSPLLIGITGGLFFASVVFLRENNSLASDAILYAVIIGSIQNVISKSTKYTLFDVSKEMTYIPLNAELKIKGKAAVEVVGNKFGKALGSGIQVLLFTLNPLATFDSISHILMIVFILVVITWLMSIKKLNEEYIKLVK